jgi:hypothetical protein
MSLNLRAEQMVGRQPPLRALLFTCLGDWLGTDAFLANLDGRLFFGNRVVAEPIRVSRLQWPNGSRARLRRGQALAVELTAVTSDAAIRFIEDARGTGDIAFRLEIQYQWHEATSAEGETCSVGAVNWNQGTVLVQPLARSRWLQILGEMKWAEIELFEIPAAPFPHFQHLPQAIDRMRQAESALRNGDWNAVLAHCRAALEAAAKSEARSDDLKKGFELLFDAALPEHSEKRKALDKIVKALTEYAHLGRHEQFPALQITKPEAEFVFTTILGLFSFLGRRLSTMEPIGED